MFNINKKNTTTDKDFSTIWLQLFFRHFQNE